MYELVTVPSRKTKGGSHMFIEIGELTLQLVFNLDFGGIEVAPLYFIVGRHVGNTEDKKKTRTKKSRRKGK